MARNWKRELRPLIHSLVNSLIRPDPWLDHQNAWEIPRFDVAYDIRFYGHAERTESGKAIWSGGQEVVAVAYDVPIPGFETKNTNNMSAQLYFAFSTSSMN
jgi:hypothetical protein